MAIKQLDKVNFKKLYTDNYGALVNFAYSKTNDWDLSKEIVQGVFTRFWSGRNNINIRTSAKNYLFSMVRNGIIDHYRLEKRKSNLDEITNSENLFVEEDTNSEQIEYELRYNLKVAIENLKDKRRRIFELSKYEGLTYKEISDYLNISERAVEDNISKALKQIREYFSNNNLYYLWNN